MQERVRINKLYDQFISALYADDFKKAAEIATSEETIKDTFFRISLAEYEIDGINFLLSSVTLTPKDIATLEKLGYQNNDGVNECAYYAIYLDMKNQYAAQQKAESDAIIEPKETLSTSANKPGRNSF